MEKSNSSHINNTKRLSIQVSLDGFSFYSHDRSTEEPQLLDQYFLDKTTDPEKILKLIQNSFQVNDLLVTEFDEVQVVYYNNLFSLVPASLFNPENLPDYLKYNVKILSTDFLAYDEVAEKDLRVVYIPFANINNYFFDCFGSFTYHHHSSLFLKNVIKNAFEEKKEIYIEIRSKDFDLIALEGHDVQLINNFTYETAEDCLYHILFCYEQLGFDPNIHELKALGCLNVDSDLYSLAHKYIRNITILESQSLGQLSFS